MRKIVYTRPEGGVSIVTPVINRNDPKEWTEADSEQRAWARLPVDAINPRFVDASEIPADRSFRDAWAHDLSVDMDKARDVHRDNLREQRAPLFAAIDAQYMKALQTGDARAQAEITARARALRDVTADPGIAAARTPEELKAVVPEAITADLSK